MKYSELSKEDLLKEFKNQEHKLAEFKAKNLKLDLSRGKPSEEQLKLSLGLLDAVNSKSNTKCDNINCLNYGGLDGLSQMKQIFADMLNTSADNIFAGGNSSLTLMFMVLNNLLINGTHGCKPWGEVKDRKFLCPVPGYDRHFQMTEHFGFKLIPVKMNSDGPDMDEIEELIKNDESVKGVWCVPKYQNPTGIIFSDEVVERFSKLKPKAKDFRIFWDNAYCLHNFNGNDKDIPDIISLCKENGNEDMVYEFCSTSKITFPGAGVAALATGKNNLQEFKTYIKYATIGPDKINQLRHINYFKDINGVRAQMKKHAAILKEKFNAVYDILNSELKDCGIADWTDVVGGYFISFNVTGCSAKELVGLCKDMGVVFTPAGATYPYGIDPTDSNIRLAPSFATKEDIKTSVSLLCAVAKYLSLKKLLNK